MKRSLGAAVRKGMGALLFLLFSFVPLAGAQVVLWDPEDIEIPADDDGIYLNPATGEVSQSMPAGFVSGPWLNLLFGGTVLGSSGWIEPVISGPPTGHGDGLAVRLDELEVVGPGLDFALGENGSENHTGSAPEQFQPGSPGYLGFRFTLIEEGPFHYGWMRMTVNDAGVGMVHRWAFESQAGESIQINAVPEPGTTILALAAALPLLLSRRRVPEGPKH